MQNTLPIGQFGEGEDVATAPAGREQLTYLIHDMQSIVTSVGLMVELLERAARAGDDSAHRARAESARTSCRQMASLCAETARLLDGTVDEGTVPQDFDLLALLVEAMTVYSPIYELAGKTLKLVSKRRSPRFFGIRSQLFRAVSNLLDNGLNHTSKGSSVVVTCAGTQNEIAVAISDDGPGMKGLAAGKARQVDPLPVVVERLSVVAAARVPGTGLRFVSEVVASHGGSSTIEQNTSGGTTVTMKFLKH